MFAKHHQIPITLEDCFYVIHLYFKKEAPNEWKRIMESETEEIMIEYHHSLGRWIRNNWGLWKKEGWLYEWFVKEFSIEHPDDMSGMLLTAFWRYWHNLPLEMEMKADIYKEHWKNIMGENNAT